MLITVVLASGAVLAGWFFAIDFLKNPVEGQIPVAPTTATCFILCGVAYATLVKKESQEEISRHRTWLIAACTILVSIICMLVIGHNYCSGTIPDFEQILFPYKLNAVDKFAPGRMSPSTAIYFLMVSLSLSIFDRRLRLPYSQGLLVFMLFMALLNLVGYFYGLPYLCGLGAFTRIAGPTALGFLLLGTSLLLIRPEQKIMHLLTNDTFGGITARAILPVAILCPAIIGWIAATGEQNKVWNWTYGAAFMVVSNIAILCIVVALLSKKLEGIDKEKRIALEEKESLATQRDTFMAVLTHDLKNPLIGADRVLDGLLRGNAGSLSEEQTHALLLLRQSNEDLLSMVKTLLHLYKYDRDAEVLFFETTSIEPAIEEAVSELLPLAKNHQIELRHQVSDSTPTVRIDRTAMSHVITNLIQNAIKFSGKNAVIEVTAENLDDDFCLVKIHDNGPGIPKRVLEHLFERYSQGDSGKHYKTGTGLGLFLCHQIVQAHDGTLTCVSAEDTGTTFAIMLRKAVAAHERVPG